MYTETSYSERSRSSGALKRDRREPASHDLLSRLNVVARCSREDSRKFTLTCNPALTPNRRRNLNFHLTNDKVAYTSSLSSAVTQLTYKILCCYNTERSVENRTQTYGKRNGLTFTHIMCNLQICKSSSWKWPPSTLKLAGHVMNRLLNTVWSSCPETATVTAPAWFTHRQSYRRADSKLHHLRHTVQWICRP